MFLKNSKFQWVLQFCIISCFIAITSVSTADQMPSTRVATPESVLNEFYTWYLQLLAKNKDPLTDEPIIFSKYVSAKLIHEIEKEINSPDGMEYDHFIQAQDYMDEWLTNISVTTQGVYKDKATATVTLGGSQVRNVH